MATLIVFWNILKVALGLGFVIFLHELGHFLLAKWNGVKVEKFSIGFGPTLAGFRRGETEYVIAAIPLGGFVKMLGEGPEDEANKSSDPRAYPNKSVGARMAIISAGVIMNVLLGLACFVYAYGQGMDELPAMVGAVQPGSPAYEAGILPGDEFVAIDGRRDISFDTMTLKVRLSSAGQRVHFLIRRPDHEGPIPILVEPRRDESSSFPRIGVAPASSLVLADPPFYPPAGMSASPKTVLKSGDRLVALGLHGNAPEPIADAEQLHRLMARHRAETLDLVFERGASEKPGKARGGTSERLTVSLPPNHAVDFGFLLTMEPISSIRAGSPADKAGFRKGDTIVRVEGREDFGPMRLADYVYRHAGRTLSFVVKRSGERAPKEVELTVIPDDTPPWLDEFGEGPMDVPGLGLSYPVRARIRTILPGSPAEKAGLKPGDVISKVVLPPSPLRQAKGAKPRVIALSDKAPEWPTVFLALQSEPKQPIELTVNGSKTSVTLTPTDASVVGHDDEWYLPQRGLAFQTLIRRLPPQPAAAALKRGFDDTVDNILRIYAMLRSLAQSRVSPKLLGGPIMIAQVAYVSSDTGLTELIRFLGMLSINLAVLNFLPIPPLDGGQMMFLVAEKVRGRPLPDSAVITVSWIGIVLLICLMAYVMYQDVYRLVIRNFF